MVVDTSNHTGAAKEQNRIIIENLYQQAVQYAAAQVITEPVMMTTEEYLEGMQNLNLNNLVSKMRVRIRKERELDMAGEVAKIISLYLKLVEDGVTPQEALMLTSEEFATDAGLLKGLKMADLAKQMSGGEQNQTPDGGAQGTNPKY